MVSMITYIYRFCGLIFLCGACIGAAFSQTPTTCAVTAVPPTVHSEGLAEQLGDIIFQCMGTPGVTVKANLSVLLPVSITNRIDSNSYSTDATLTIDTGTGPVPSGVSGLVTNQSITFSSIQFTVPASGIVGLRLTDLRADVNQLGLVQTSPLVAYLSSTLALSNNPVIVAFAQQGLLASQSSDGVRCQGSPSPASLSLTNLFATGTAEETTRVTEGFAQAFAPKDATSDTGTRFLINYTNFPAGTTIYVPDAVAGATALVPTSASDFGAPAAVGQYKTGSGTLLLVRVLNAAPDGSGGTLATLPAPNSAGVLVLDGAQAVTVTNGAGYAVYETVDTDSGVHDSAQIPSFFGIPAYSQLGVANVTVELAPISTVTTASTTAPIPRFAAVTPPGDCEVLGDCTASYVPLLQVSGPALTATAVAGGHRVTEGYLKIHNARGGTMEWSATVTYTNGSGWAIVDTPFGFGDGVVGVIADPSALTPGTYQATLLIDAGPLAGSQTFPITLTVTAAAPTPVSSSVAITSVTNAANFHAGPVAPGSLASVFGSGFAGKNVSVTFGGAPANLLYTGATQINLRVPPGLTGQSSQMVVTVDGATATSTVQLAPVAPAVFTPGILNQDNTVNSASSPAPAGSVLQIFGTGLPDSGGAVTITIQNRSNLLPLYAGAAPGLPGLQQVNVAVPADLPAMTANLTICASVASQNYCSQPVTVVVTK